MNGNHDSIEEIAYKLYPNLGRQSRPDNIDFNEYLIGQRDFCKISQIPFDVKVKLRPDTECSCAVYFVYRKTRKIKKHGNWLHEAPLCYQQKYLATNNKSLNELMDLNLLERACDFDDLVLNCEKLNNNLIDNIEKSKSYDVSLYFV